MRGGAVSGASAVITVFKAKHQNVERDSVAALEFMITHHSSLIKI